MRISPKLVALGVGIAGSTALFTSSARAADPTQECIDASEQAQKLKAERKYGLAREKLLFCAREVCPTIIRRDCGGQWLTDVEQSMSSVVFAVKVNGKDVDKAKVSVDGKIVTESLDGKSNLIDPGKHKLHVEVEGRPAYEEDILVAEGQKNRTVTAEFNDARKVIGPLESPPSAEKKFPVVPVVLLGAGAVLVGVGALAFWLPNSGKLDDLKTECSPFPDGKCPANYVSADGKRTASTVDQEAKDAKTQLVIGDIMAAAGVVSIGVGVVLLITSGSSGSSDAPPKTASTKFNFSPLPGGGGAGFLSGSF